MFNTYYKRIGKAIITGLVVSTSIFGFYGNAHAAVDEAAIQAVLDRVDSTFGGSVTQAFGRLNPEEQSVLANRLSKLLLNQGGAITPITNNMKDFVKRIGLPIPDPSNRDSNVKVSKALDARGRSQPGNPSEEFRVAVAELSGEERDLYNKFVSTLDALEVRATNATVGAKDNPFKVAAEYWTGECSLVSLDHCVAQIIAFVGNLAAYLAGAILWLSAEAFGFAVTVSITQFHLFANMPVVLSVWSIGRDLANMFFIFILLYSAIGTLLDIGKASLKQNLSRILIVAIFINFSMPIARAFIDATNVIAIEVYNKMIPEDQYRINRNPAWFVVDSLAPKSGLSIKELITGTPPGRGDSNLTTTTAIVSSFGATIVTLATAFTFLAGAVLLLYRALSLLFVLALSSLAFFSHLIPKADYYGQWWDGLINNAVFAPIYMFLLYFVLRVMGESNLEAILASASSTGAFSGALATAVYYMILLGLLNGAMMIASKCNIEGKDWVKGYMEKARGYVKGRAQDIAMSPVNLGGRKIVGGISRYATGENGENRVSRFVKNFATQNPTVGGAMFNTLKGGTKAFGQEEKDAAAKKLADAFKGDAARQANILTNTNSVAAQRAYNAMTPEERERAKRIAVAAGGSGAARFTELEENYERTKNEIRIDPTTGQRLPDQARVGERTKAQGTVDKEDLIGDLSTGGNGTYTPTPAGAASAGANQRSLHRMNNEEINKVLSGVLGRGGIAAIVPIVNDLKPAQFKSFITNEASITALSPGLRDALRDMANAHFVPPGTPRGPNALARALAEPLLVAPTTPGVTNQARENLGL